LKIRISYAVIVIGVILGVLGFVRSGAVTVAFGTAAIAYFRFNLSDKKRKIELTIPIALALILFVVALTLPHGK
jgi:hypothetical protein